MSRALSDFRRDRARYPRTAWVTERALWAVAVYRLGQAVLSLPGPSSRLLMVPYRVLYLLIQVVTGIELDPRAKIGPGLRIYHAGPIVVHAAAVVGEECVLNLGNVIGVRDQHGCPTLGDRVRLGAAAQVLGAVEVGDDSYIGAMSLVIDDVPAGSVVAGVPARPVRTAARNG